MSSPTRKRGERGDENDSDWATHPSPRREHTDSSGDDANSEESRSATSRLWQVFYDLSAFKDQNDIDFQPQAFLALIEDVLCNRRDEVDYRVRIAARSILSSRIFDKFFNRIFIDFTQDNSDLVDEFRLLQWIDSFRLDMSRAEEWESEERLDEIDRIVSYIIFTMWDGKDWLLDRLPLIERIVAFIVEKIEGEDKMDRLCLIKQTVSFIRKIIGEKDGRIDKLCLIRRITNVIAFPIEDSGYCILSTGIIIEIVDYLDGLVLKKDDLVDQLNLIDLIVSYFLGAKMAEKGAEVDKLCLIEGMASFIDGIIIDKDDQVGKLGQIMQIVKLLENIDEFGSYVNLCNLELMKHIVTLLEMIKGEKDDQVDKLSLMEHIISFLEDDRRFDKLKLIQYIVFRSRRKLLGHRSCRTIDEAFDGDFAVIIREEEQPMEGPPHDSYVLPISSFISYMDFAVIIREEEQPMEGPTHDTINDKPTTTTRAVKEPKAYKRRSRYLKHFTEHGGNKWSCNLCEDNNHLKKILLQRNGSSSTTIFQRHLKRYHNDVYNEIERDAVKQKK